MKIGELATMTGINASKIRYYESIGLLPDATRGENGYRDYDVSDAERLKLIDLAQQLGFSLKEIQEYMPARGEVKGNCNQIVENLQRKLDDTDQMIESLKARKVRITEAIAYLEEEAVSGRKEPPAAKDFDMID